MVFGQEETNKEGQTKRVRDLSNNLPNSTDYEMSTNYKKINLGLQDIFNSS
jgi:hypothetical protein